MVNPRSGGTNAFRGISIGTTAARRRRLTIRAGGAGDSRTATRALSGPIVRTRPSSWPRSSISATYSQSPRPTRCPRRRCGGRLQQVATQVFDPAAATSAGAHTAFAGNVIPASHQRWRAYAALCAAEQARPHRQQLRTNQLRPYGYNSGMGRIDHSFSSGNRLFGTTTEQRRGSLTGRRTPVMPRTAGRSTGPRRKGFDYRSNVSRPAAHSAPRRACCSTCAPAGPASASRATRRRIRSMKLGFARRRRRCSRTSTTYHSSRSAACTTNENSTIRRSARRSDYRATASRPMDTYSITPT